MLVKDRMHHPVITVHPDTNLPEAQEIMRVEKIRRLPVVNHRGQMVGIVTENDLDKAAPSQATALSKWELRDLTRKITMEKIMTREVIVVTEDTPLEDAARIMVNCDISALPVVRDHKLVGIITEMDLFKAFIEMLGGREKGVRMSVILDRAPGQLAKLSQAIFAQGGDIIGLAVYEGDSSETGTITVKVAGVEPEALVKSATPLVEKVVDVRESGTDLAPLIYHYE
jgi:acetoin utilization protein AcuB